MAHRPLFQILNDFMDAHQNEARQKDIAKEYFAASKYAKPSEKYDVMLEFLAATSKHAFDENDQGKVWETLDAAIAHAAKSDKVENKFMYAASAIQISVIESKDVNNPTTDAARLLSTLTLDKAPTLN